MPIFEAKNPSGSGNRERRADKRYELALEVRWKMIRRRKVLATGTGRTVNLSSGGILFDAGQTLVAGLKAEVTIAWPVLFDKVVPMHLVISGEVLRTEGSRAAVRLAQHEFRLAPVGGGSMRDSRGPRLEFAPPTVFERVH